MQRDCHVVSVIIPTLGRDTLALCQAALARQTRPPNEVIPVFDRERRGISWARNQGIRQATGDLIAFTDDDAIPPDDWLEKMIAALDRFDAAVAGGTFQETDPLLDAIRRRQPMPKTEVIDNGRWVGNGGNILFRRECLMACAQQDGYVFNESILGEDWELIWRLRRRGATMVYVPTTVTHLRRATPWQHCCHSFQRGVGIACLYKLQQGGPTGVIVQDSLLWGQNGQKAKPRWGQAVREKLVGPFDMSHFEKKQHFWLFWLGEKFQAAGFVWGMLRQATFGRSSSLFTQ